MADTKSEEDARAARSFEDMGSPVCIILPGNIPAKPRVIGDRGGVIAAEGRLSALLKTVVEKAER
jgi:hypothetical protein